MGESDTAKISCCLHVELHEENIQNRFYGILNNNTKLSKNGAFLQ
jgi:hypothetical protein